MPISFSLFIVLYASVGGELPLISWCNEYHFWNMLYFYQSLDGLIISILVIISKVVSNL